ncbi:MAG: hypothetical protein AB7G39_17075 [Alphaproteobacteria bacterium]
MSMRQISRIEEAARISVLRALGFAGLAIATAMVGVSFDPPTALNLGGVMTGMVGAVLAVKAWQAPTINYRRTETFMLLDRDTGLDESLSQRVVTDVLARLYHRYALYHAYIAATFLIIAYAA